MGERLSGDPDILTGSLVELKNVPLDNIYCKNKWLYCPGISIINEL